MTPDPLVTVIIPSYNHSSYIKKCIDSVLSQSYPLIEVIVIDDGSTDDSLEIIRSYGDRIHLLQQKGGRQARARNLGMAVARGELVAFLDSDDKYLAGRIESAVNVFRRYPDTDLVWGDFRLIDATGEMTKHVKWQQSARDFRLQLIEGNPICNATVTVRRSALDEIGGFDERVPRACDGLAWYQLAARGKHFRHCGQTVLDYRVHGGNDSRSFELMTRERDVALQLGVVDYLRLSVISSPAQLRWLRGVMIRQFAFGAAANLQYQIGWKPLSALLALVFRLLGSHAGLQAFSWLRMLKNMLRRRAI